jgi:integrase/recombinase XerD
MRVGEAIGLDRGDTDLDAAALTVRNGKHGKSRLVPVHDTTTRALRDYLRLRDRLCPDAAAPAVLVSPAGTRLLYCNVHATWKKLAASADLRPRSGSCRPRIHDYADVCVMPTRAGESLVAGLPARFMSV